jgi:DNA-binding LytR/AlgR family response regulator
MLKAITIDDEPVALEVIRNLSEKVVFLEVEAYFTNVFEATDFLQKNKVDLVFLDIKMPDMSGIELIKSLSNPPMVIFTTAYSEHAVHCFELDAIDYLLKPFSLTRFLKACNKAYEHVELRKNNGAAQTPPPSLFIKSGYEHVRVEMENILYVESYGNYVQFVTNGQKILSRLTMSEAEVLLPASAFLRIHRSYIVAKSKVAKFEKRSIWIGQIELPIGPGYCGKIEKLIK